MKSVTAFEDDHGNLHKTMSAAAEHDFYMSAMTALADLQDEDDRERVVRLLIGSSSARGSLMDAIKRLDHAQAFEASKQ